MNLKQVGLLVFVCMAALGIKAQSQAALDKLHQRYTAEQLEDMRLHAHHKYQGLQHYYAASFLVIDNGQPRAATEAEVAAIDIDQYRALRQEKNNVEVHDAMIGKDVVLLSRDAFERVVLDRLDEQDRRDYLAYKAAATDTHSKNQD
jgi:hypothetical protein